MYMYIYVYINTYGIYRDDGLAITIATPIWHLAHAKKLSPRTFCISL